MAKSIKKELSKVNKLLHPKSRKAQKLREKATRLENKEQTKKLHKMRENLVGEKILWFKEHLVPDAKVYTKSMVLDIIEQYLARFDEELEQISIRNSIGFKKRRYASREDIINMTISHDKEEFETCGLEIPHLLNQEQLAFLRNWNGELRYLQNFQLKRYTRGSLLMNSNASIEKKKKLPSDRESTSQDNNSKSCDGGEMEKEDGHTSGVLEENNDKIIENACREEKNDSLASATNSYPVDTGLTMDTQ